MRMMRSRVIDLCIDRGTSIREAISCIDRNQKGIVLVVDDAGRLTGTITDGDIRRAILDGVSLDVHIQVVLKRETMFAEPVTAPDGTDPGVLLQLMKERDVRQIPLLDPEGRVVDLVTLDDLVPEEPAGMQAVIMAGGFGRRLRPLTETLPKPMLPIGDRPLLERTIEQLQQAGIDRVNVTTHFQPEKISEHFGDGTGFGVQIEYVTEERPLGTAGSLSLMAAPKKPVLVINGDILTRVDFRAMLAFHREHRADLTVAVRQYDIQVPYAVLECDDHQVRRIREKPAYSYFVNAGIYLLEPAVHPFIPAGEQFDMTDLIDVLISDGRMVVSFPIVEYWLDIGQHDDYKQAQDDLHNGSY